jgi:hypothetical protein
MSRRRRAVERASERLMQGARPAKAASATDAAFFDQQVLDPGFASAGSHTLGGAGIGTSAVAGGVLQITSTTAAYTELPATRLNPLPAATYLVTFTIGSYASGTISIAASATANLASSTDGTSRTADGTYAENLVLATPGYIGLKGQGAAVVNSMQIDNLTIVRVGS